MIENESFKNEDPNKINKEEIQNEIKDKDLQEINNQKVITFDTLHITSKINKNKIYHNKDLNYEYIFCLNENSEDKKKEKYFASIFSTFKYIGSLSEELKREGFGYYLYDVEDEGDEYAGNWKDNKKDGDGIYIYKKNENDREELYLGKWVNGSKHGKGIYFYKNHKNEKLNDGDYDVILGEFENDYYKDGYIISKKGNDETIYKGKMNKEGDKEDEHAMYFENGNKSFYGKFANNEMEKGRIIIFDENNTNVPKTKYYFEKIDDNYEFDVDKFSEFDAQLIGIKANIEKEKLQNDLINGAYKFCIELIPKINDIEKIKVFEVKKDFIDKFEIFLNFKIENMNENNNNL